MKKHDILKKYIIGLSKGYSNSLICISKAGLGKTETTMNALKELGYMENKHYIYVSNYITPIELYKLLQEVNNLQSLRDFKAVGILKGALWPINGRRRVCWVSGTHKIKEQTFDFTGSIIFLLNEFKKKNALLNAVADRGFYYDFNLSTKEMLDLMVKRAEEREVQVYLSVFCRKRIIYIY